MKVLFFLLGLIVINSSVSAQKGLSSAFKSGELLSYKSYYGFIDAGVATLKLEEKLLDDKKVFHAKAIAKTTGWCDNLFYVLDIYESYFDVVSGLPVKSIRNVREDKYKKYSVVTFDHNKNTVNSDVSGVRKVPDNILDIVSAYYYFRNADFSKLKKGDIIKYKTFFHDDIWELKVRYEGIEEIELDLGLIECMKFRPIVEEGTFEDSDALSLWISNDKNKIPVRVQMDFFVGSFKTDLIAFSGLQNSIYFKED